MKLTKILLPTDFSAHSYEALRTAEMLTHQSGAELLIVHVLDPSGEDATEADRRQVEQRLFTTMPACSDLNVDHALLDGDTATEIVRIAGQRHVDLIVMGSHGRTGIPRVLMGSVASQVLHDAPCDLLTVRPRIQLRGDIKAWAHRKAPSHEDPSDKDTLHEGRPRHNSAS